MGNGMHIDPRNLLLYQLQIAMQLVKQQEEKTAKGLASITSVKSAQSGSRTAPIWSSG